MLFPHAIEGYLAEEFEFGTPDEENEQLRHRSTLTIATLLFCGAAIGASSAVPGATSAPILQEGETRYITGGLGFHVDDQEPIITLRADWVWFPLEDDYPFDNIGEEGRVRVYPRILTAYVNFGCHFEGLTR